MAKLKIRLVVADGCVRGVEIGSRRAEGAAAGFAGMMASEVPGRIGLIFSLCRQAQGIAALGAVEAALGVQVAPGALAARNVLRRAEMLSQVAMRLALHWPRALGLAPDPSLPRACLAGEAALEAALFGGAVWKVPGAGLDRPDLAEVGRIIEGLDAAVADFVAQTGLRAALAAAGLQRFGALPAGMTPEGGSLTRRWDTPAVAQVRAAQGNGLATRLEASLAELETIPGELRAALEQVSAADIVPAERDTGSGGALVDTARGLLRHWVQISGGKVTAWRIGAPTEVNFRPGGPVEAGLLGARADGIERAAALHLLAIDPCVEVDLEVAHA